MKMKKEIKCFFIPYFLLILIFLLINIKGIIRNFQENDYSNSKESRLEEIIKKKINE